MGFIWKCEFSSEIHIKPVLEFKLKAMVKAVLRPLVRANLKIEKDQKIDIAFFFIEDVKYVFD